MSISDLTLYSSKLPIYLKHVPYSVLPSLDVQICFFNPLSLIEEMNVFSIKDAHGLRQLWSSDLIHEPVTTFRERSTNQMTASGSGTVSTEDRRFPSSKHLVLHELLRALRR